MHSPRFRVAVLAPVLVLAGCGGGDDRGGDPVEQVPQAGLRAQLREARAVRPSDFPAPEGQSLRELGTAIGGGPELGLATSVLTVGENRVAFGIIDQGGQFLYGKTALYLARRPGAPARGPFPAPADVLVTEPAFRSRQAATETDPF